MAAGDKGARFINRKTEIRSETGLANLFNKKPVAGQHVPDDAQIRHVRLHCLRLREGCVLDSLELVLPRRFRHSSAMQLRTQLRSTNPGVTDNGNIGFNARTLRRVDIDVDDLQPVRLVRPAEPLQLHPRANPDQHIGFGPAPEAGCTTEPEVMFVADDTSATAKRHDRCLQAIG